MRHNLISGIKTRIRNKRQIVIIEFSHNECVFLAPQSIKQNTGLEAFELELLIGSTLRIDFYKKGDKMTNNLLCEKDNVIVKEYFFELQQSVDTLRIKNKNRLLPFKKIKDIFYFHKYNKTNVGIKTEDNMVTFISLSNFEKQTSLDKNEQHILIGSYIFSEYFKKGEKLITGGEVYADNKILKWINLRYSDNIKGMHEKFEDLFSYYDGKKMHNSSESGSKAYGYDSWEEMAFIEAFEGDTDAWNHYNQ